MEHRANTDAENVTKQDNNVISLDQKRVTSDTISNQSEKPSLTLLPIRTGNTEERDTRYTNSRSFPVEVLPKQIQEFIEEAAESIVCPPDLVGLPLLVMLGSAIGNSRVIKIKEGWEEGALLYAASVALPGEKKSPAANAALRPIRKVQSQLMNHYKSKKNKSKDESKGLEPKLERTYVDDTTVEGLARVLNDNHRGLLVAKDELDGWVRSMDQYKAKGSDRQFWLSAWSSSSVAVDRKSQDEPIMLDKPFVSIYGNIQPAILHELAGKRDDGLLDRFLFAYPDSMVSRWSDTELREETSSAIMDLYIKLRGLSLEVDGYDDPLPTPVYFSDDAKELFKGLVNSHRKEMDRVGFPQSLRGPWSKLESYLARLSLILSLVRSTSEGRPERIETDDVLGAKVLLDYFKVQTRKVYDLLYTENPKELFVIDVINYVVSKGGYVKDEPASIYSAIQSDHKPKRPDDMTKWLKDIATYTPSLCVKSGSSNGRRYLSLTVNN